MAKRFGVSEESVAAILEGQKDPSLFNQREIVALEYAEAVTKDSSTVSNELYQRMQGFFNDAEIIEITCLIGIFNYFNRFNNALQVDITK